MKNKLVAITGANDGIGYATSKQLLLKGFSLVMFCRDIQKAEKAKDDLIQQTANSKIEIIQVELSSFRSIEKSCSVFLEKFEQLDVLINNAGVMQSSFSLSEDEIEMTMAVNHFGTFLMTYYLLKALKNATQGRIVNLSSRAHFDVRLDFDEINEEKYFNFRKQYKYSKLANVLFTRKLAELLDNTNVTCNCLDPGVVKTSIGSKTNSRLFSWAWKLFTLTGVSPDRGAETVIFLATSKRVENISGEYYEECEICETSDAAIDNDQKESLWNWSLKKTGIEHWEF